MNRRVYENEKNNNLEINFKLRNATYNESYMVNYYLKNY